MTRYREPMAHRPESRVRLAVETLAFLLCVVGIVLVLSLDGISR